MVILSLQLHDPRFTLIEADGVLHSKIWFDGVFVGKELCVKDGDSSEFPTTAIVTFIATKGSELMGKLTYSEKWHDEDTNVIYPGSCQLSLPACSDLWALLQSSDRGDRNLYLTIKAMCGWKTIYLMGEGDEGQYYWNPTVENPMPIRIESIGLVPAVNKSVNDEPIKIQGEDVQITLTELLTLSKSISETQIMELRALTSETKKTRGLILTIALTCAAYGLFRLL